MRFLLSIAAFSLTSAASPVVPEPIHYTLAPEVSGNDLTALRVQVGFRADPSGTTDFRWDDGWNGERRLWQWARDLRVAGANAVEQRGDGHWRIRAATGAERRLRVQRIDQAFRTTYGSTSLTATNAQLVDAARARWQNTVGGLQDAMRVQAGVVGNIDTNRSQMAALVGSSQGATGALQAAQAGNQLLALQAQQLADLTAVVAANGRAQALTEAERSAAAEQGREQRRRFLTPGAGCQTGNARMFNNGN